LDEKRFIDHIKENQGLLNKLIGLYADNPEEKKDLYQEVLYQCWNSRNSYRSEARFSTWLYRLCLNTILTHQRKQKPVRYTDDIAAISPSVPHASVATEDSARLYAAIKQLAETDKAIISLHLDGYDNQEIGEIMGISKGNVAVKIYRIKEQLTKLLKS
jgi:RNA polymerase sigma factor (sigma-70 family)